MPDSPDPKKHGVYPGSFNPLTTAHLAIADTARRQYGLQRIELAVSTLALAKEDVLHPRFEHRIEVLEEATAGIGWLAVTVTDKQLLTEIASSYDLLIVGADKWWQIQDPIWYGGDPGARDRAMAELPPVAIAPRDGLETPAELTLGVSRQLIHDVSSSAARDGRLELMVPAARAFARRTGAWIDPERYERWLTTGPDRDR